MAYNKLSTANLPDPVIDPAQGSSPEDYFNTVTYTGNSLNPASVTGVGFQPDFVWVKTRSFGNTNHRLQDVVRGSNKRLMSDLTNAEIDTAGGIQSFDADGFTVGDGTSKDGFIHFGGRTFVAWNWKANGSGVSNTDGSIPSTVSANTTSGFSIGTFVGNQTAGATVGHGLSQAPEMIIIKDRPTINDWPVYHTSISPSQTIKLNSSNAAFTESTIWNNTAPTASVFTLGSSNLANNNTKSHVFYAFHSVEGFSKFGSYTGNGSSDGPFVYTGFRPAWIMWKRTNVSGQSWEILDVERDPYNGVTHYLYPDTSGAENNATGYPQDFLSNGFKIRHTGASANASGGTYIYACFAENPFKYSNAR